jgi:hypothetical protein
MDQQKKKRKEEKRRWKNIKNDSNHLIGKCFSIRSKLVIE